MTLRARDLRPVAPGWSIAVVAIDPQGATVCDVYLTHDTGTRVPPGPNVVTGTAKVLTEAVRLASAANAPTYPESDEALRAWRESYAQDLRRRWGHGVSLVGSSWRGHPIAQRADGAWVYVDTMEPVQGDPQRACGHCRQPNRADEHDACLGELPGVVNACCGHGEESAAYVQCADGRWLGGLATRQAQSTLVGHGEERAP